MNGRVALITGGASGIGRAIGEAMAMRGAEVVLADRQIDLAKDVARGIALRGGDARAVELDVRNAATFNRVVAEVLGREGRIDYLFNNAGIGIAGEISDYDLRAWEDVFDVNLRGVAYGIQSVYPVMQRQGSGHIINTASMAGLLPIAGAGSYTATKHAVVGLSKVLRLEARRHGVRVSVLCPGVIQTPILGGGVFGGHVGTNLIPADVEKLWKWMRPMNVDTFAQLVLCDVDKNEPYIIVPRWWKAAWAIERLTPRLSQRMWGIFHELTVKRIAKEAELK